MLIEIQRPYCFIHVRRVKSRRSEYEFTETDKFRLIKLVRERAILKAPYLVLVIDYVGSEKTCLI